MASRCWGRGFRKWSGLVAGVGNCPTVQMGKSRLALEAPRMSESTGRPGWCFGAVWAPPLIPGDGSVTSPWSLWFLPDVCCRGWLCKSGVMSYPPPDTRDLTHNWCPPPPPLKVVSVSRAPPLEPPVPRPEHHLQLGHLSRGQEPQGLCREK